MVHIGVGDLVIARCLGIVGHIRPDEDPSLGIVPIRNAECASNAGDAVFAV